MKNIGKRAKSDSYGPKETHTFIRTRTEREDKNIKEKYGKKRNISLFSISSFLLPFLSLLPASPRFFLVDDRGIVDNSDNVLLPLSSRITLRLHLLTSPFFFHSFFISSSSSSSSSSSRFLIFFFAKMNETYLNKKKIIELKGKINFQRKISPISPSLIIFEKLYAKISLRIQMANLAPSIP